MNADTEYCKMSLELENKDEWEIEKLSEKKNQYVMTQMKILWRKLSSVASSYLFLANEMCLLGSHDA